MSPATPAAPERANICVPDTVLIPGSRLAHAPLGPAISIPPFWLGRTAVTNREYSSFLQFESVPEPPWWRDPRFSSPRQPVVGVSWHDAVSYCRWLGRITGGIWRLPTEAEWELAAAAGQPSPPTAWGDVVPPGEIPEGRLEAPWEVGRGTPNGFGLMDMGTIVHEWCSDWREDGRPDAPPRRASRGGSWRHRIRWSSPSARSSLPPDYRYSDYGFRVAREGEDDRVDGAAEARAPVVASKRGANGWAERGDRLSSLRSRLSAEPQRSSRDGEPPKPEHD